MFACTGSHKSKIPETRVYIYTNSHLNHEYYPTRPKDKIYPLPHKVSCLWSLVLLSMAL